MTLSRRQKRYIRRKEKRELKKKQFLAQYDDFNRLTSFNNLCEATTKASNHVSWKISVQKYIIDTFIKNSNLSKKLLQLKDIRQGFICFKCLERGKVRSIRAVHFSERIVQKNLCRSILYPIYTHYIIHDNYANQKGKGTSFAIKRFEYFLRQFYKKYGREGYILFIDFKDYFGNIDHGILKSIYREYIKDPNLLFYIDKFVEAFGDKSLGLGSETSQLHGIMYANKLDHYIKSQLGIKYYGRYMDDSFIILHDKSELEEIRDKIIEKCKQLKITVNTKKTKIKDLKHGFKFLKTRYLMLETGKLLKRPTRYAVTKERKKLKKLLNITDITNKQIWQNFNSWKGSLLTKDCRKLLYKEEMKLKRHIKQRNRKKYLV